MREFYYIFYLLDERKKKIFLRNLFWLDDVSLYDFDFVCDWVVIRVYYDRHYYVCRFFLDESSKKVMVWSEDVDVTMISINLENWDFYSSLR